MATTFYGPWYVVLGRVHSQFRQQRFIISGSDNADGIYPVTFGNALVLSVQGTQWQIQMEIIPLAIILEGVPWEPSLVRESMKFVLGEGLVVQLDGSFQFEAPDPPTLVMTLTCTSMDPEINPIPTANPFSFTLGEGSYSGGDNYHRQSYRQE
jgi:hypothetical protein